MAQPPEQIAARVAGLERSTLAREEVKAVIQEMNATAAWDHIQAREVDPKILDFVAERLHAGVPPGEITRELGLSHYGGKNSKQWKKIAAYFRQGFRADAEAYLFQQSHKFFKTIELAKDVLEDAFENGTPQMDADGNVHYVKGATKELGSFLESYSKAIMLPLKLWKEFGAIGEKKDAGAGNGGVTIIVKTNVPRPTQEEVDTYRSRLQHLPPVIDVTPMPSPSPEEAPRGDRQS